MKEWGRVVVPSVRLFGPGDYAMARAKPTEETTEKVLAAILGAARENDTLPEVVAAAMKQLRETDPKVAHAALRAMIDAMAASLPAPKRRKFLEELLVFLRGI